MLQDFDYKLIVYYYPTNKINYKDPIGDKRRFKIWCRKNVSLVADIEFVFDNSDVLNPGQIKEVKVQVLNDEYFNEMINSGYRIFFGEVGDVRLGEIVAII